MRTDIIDEELQTKVREHGIKGVPLMWYLGKDGIDQPLIVCVIPKWPRRLESRPPQMSIPWTSLAMLDLGLFDSTVFAAIAAAKPVEDIDEPPSAEHILKMARGETELGELLAVIEIETRNDRGEEYTAIRLLPFLGGQEPGTAYFPPDDMFTHKFSEPEDCAFLNDLFVETFKACESDVEEEQEHIREMRKRPKEAWVAMIDVLIGTFKGQVWVHPSIATKLLADERFVSAGIDDKGRTRLIWQDDYDPSADLTVDREPES